EKCRAISRGARIAVIYFAAFSLMLGSQPPPPPVGRLRWILPCGLAQTLGNGGRYGSTAGIVPQHLFRSGKLQHLLRLALLLVSKFLLLFLGKFRFLFHDEAKRFFEIKR